MPGDYPRPSLLCAGIDPDAENEGHVTMDFGGGGAEEAKVWRDIWGLGQGIGAVEKIQTVEALVDRLAGAYDRAQMALLDATLRRRPNRPSG